jgi:hypothetical protein
MVNAMLFSLNSAGGGALMLVLTIVLNFTRAATGAATSLQGCSNAFAKALETQAATSAESWLDSADPRVAKSAYFFRSNGQSPSS